MLLPTRADPANSDPSIVDQRQPDHVLTPAHAKRQETPSNCCWAATPK